MIKPIQELKDFFNKANLATSIKNLFLVLLGTLILAFGVEYFILPSSLVTGGVSGIAICFQYSSIQVNTETIITLVTWGLFFLGLCFLGLRFSLKTLLSTIFYPIFLFLFKLLGDTAPWLLIKNSNLLVGEEALTVLLSSIFGGFFVGIGCGITFLGGGSTGGVDILTFVLCKYIKRLKSTVSIFFFDAVIILSGFLIDPSHDIALCLEGILSAVIVSVVIDFVFTGTGQTFVAYIVTDKYEEITNEIIHKLDRTTSILDIEGGYSKEAKKMVMVSFTIRNYAAFMALIARLDKKAFVTITRAHEINGEGFKPIT